MLSERARATLLDWDIDPDEFARLHGDSSADEWRGDSCGCTDDRCTGHHHAEGEACGCIDAEIREYWQDINAGMEGEEVWAAHQLALTTGSKKDRAAAVKSRVVV